MNRLLNLLLGVLLIDCLTDLSAADRAEKDEKKAAGKNHKVEMLDDEFKPKAITIEEGDTITWVNKGTKTHAAASDAKVPKDLEFDTKNIDAGKSSKPIEFKKAGKIPYECEHHDGMTGTITVKAKDKPKEK